MIHLEVVVADTADLLATQAYGAGALLRWESAGAIDGTYAEGGTVALVAGVSLYDVWDAAGTSATWYRTRVSNAAASTFSAYSDPFQTATHSQYLSVAQFRAFYPSPTLTDEALLILLDAAAQDIVEAAGPVGERTERHRARGELLMLSRRALSVTAVVEDASGASLTLSADDYEANPSGQTLYRLRSGTNPSRYWRGRVDVTYRPVDDTADRQRVQRELVQLEISYAPGLQAQSIGTWSEAYQRNDPYDVQRSSILASLDPGPAVF